MKLCRLLLLLALAASCAAQTRKVVAISHRGEHLVRPENTIPAFQEAIRVGADFIEVDVQTTKDGKLVLSHDATVDRCTNGTGRIADMTFEQVEAVDAGVKRGADYAGVKIPTFAEVIDLARGKIGVYVDIKNASAHDLVDHIDGHGMTRNVVMYCKPSLCKEIQALNPKLKVMPESNTTDHVHTLVDLLHPQVIAFGAGDWKPEIIAAAKDAHAQAYVDRMGATDAPEGWQTAIDMGADGIQTDKPGPLVEYLRSKGYKN